MEKIKMYIFNKLSKPLNKINSKKIKLKHIILNCRKVKKKFKSYK